MKCCFIALMFGCAAGAAVAAAPAHALHFTALRDTPTIDGVIGTDEYPASHGFMFAIDTNFGDYEKNFLSPRPAKTYYAWDECNLYVAIRSEGASLKTDERGRDGRMYLDDSVEIWVRPLVDGAKTYQFVINAADCIFDSASSDSKWNAEGVVAKSTVTDGVWTLETAIPWKNLGIGGCHNQSMYLNVCRTYVGGVKSKGRSARWMAETPREYASIGRGGYGEWGHYAGFSLSTNVSRYAIDPFGDPTAGRITSGVRMTARAAGDVKFDVVAHGALPPWYDHHAPKAVKAGEIFETHACDAAPAEATIHLQLLDTDGRRLISGGFPYRNPKPIAYVGRRTDPKTQTLYLLTDNWILKDGEYSIRLTMKDYETHTKVVKEWTVPAKVAQGRAEQAFDVADLPPGLYRYDYAFVGPDGKTVESDYDYYAKPVGDGEWAGTTVGSEDVVPSPWTEPVAGDTSFSCWGRTYALGGDGLLTSIRTGGREILNGPVALELDGRPLRFDCVCLRRGKSFADYVLVARDAPLKLALDLHAEFDGYLKFALRYGDANRAVRIGKLELKLPLKREFVRGYDDSKTLVGKLTLESGKTGRWTFNPHLAPYFWLGDARTGLMGGQDSLRGWHLKGKKSGYRLDVDAMRATVTATFVDTPFEVRAPRTINFYLEATPTRPRNAVYANLPMEKMGFWAADSHRLFFDEWRPGFLNEEKMRMWRGMQRAGKIVHYYYGPCGNSPAAPYWGWFGDRWNSTGDPTFSIQEVPPKSREEKDRRWTKTCLNDRNFFDWKLYNLNWFLNEPTYEVKNIYIDLGFPYHCQNHVHGCCWTDDFGEPMSDWCQDAEREFYKRMRILQQRKNPDAAVIGHLQVTRTPSDAFFDQLAMGEVYENRVAAQGNYYDVLTPGDLQVGYAMRAGEHVISLIPQIYRTTAVYARHRLDQYDPKKPEFDRAIRHATAYFSIHDLSITPTDEKKNGSQWFVPQRRIQSFGDGRKVSAYYHADCPIKAEPASPRFLYAVHHGNGKALLILLNDTDAAVTKTVRFDPTSVGLSTSVGKELFTDTAFDFSAGAVPVALPPRESLFVEFD